MRQQMRCVDSMLDILRIRESGFNTNGREMEAREPVRYSAERRARHLSRKLRGVRQLHMLGVLESKSESATAVLFVPNSLSYAGVFFF